MACELHRPARFHYSSYWDTWSLLLTNRCKAAPGGGSIVEITITSSTGTNLHHVEQLRVRRHYTGPDRADVFANTLPPDAEANARYALGDACFDWLTSDRAQILGKLNWQAIADHRGGGGTPLADCVLQQFTDLIVLPATRQSRVTETTTLLMPP